MYVTEPLRSPIVESIEALVRLAGGDMRWITLHQHWEVTCNSKRLGGMIAVLELEESHAATAEGLQQVQRFLAQCHEEPVRAA